MHHMGVPWVQLPRGWDKLGWGTLGFVVCTPAFLLGNVVKVETRRFQR